MRVQLPSLPAFAVTVLASFSLVSTRAAENRFAYTNLDAAFAPGLAKLKQTAGFIEDAAGQTTNDWQPNRRLIVGVKAIEGDKRTVYFVQLTTVPPPPTNSNGSPWQPALRTNDWAWSPTNKVQFITTNYPVSVRVFNETGKLLMEGRAPMAWGILTNSLYDLCRLSLEEYGNTNPPAAHPDDHASAVAGGEKHPKEPPDERFMLATGGGFLWMINMFGNLQTVPTVSDVWGKAQCAMQMPTALTMIKAVFTGFTIVLLPLNQQVSLVNDPAAAAPLYCLPVDLKSKNRLLGHVEMIIGPAHGAEMLLAGIRTIYARHPTKPKQEFLTQVLASGHVPDGE